MDVCSACRCAASEAARLEYQGAREPSVEEMAFDALEGTRIGRYELRGLLGMGASGVVYEAFDTELHRIIAIKLMRPGAERARNELLRQRMIREGRALARINHTNVVTVYEVGHWRTLVFVAMERLTGGTLHSWLVNSHPSRDEVVAVFASLADGLQAIHDGGLVHRDLKPHNVFLSGASKPTIGDLGLACVDSDARDEAPKPVDISDSEISLTITGASLGTPAYMAPEQLRGETASCASDVYALGIMYVEAIAQRRLFTQVKFADRIEAARSLEFSELSYASDRELASAALTFESQKRKLSSGDFASALRASGPSRRTWIAYAAMASLAALAGAAALMFAPNTARNCQREGESFAAAWRDNEAQVARAFGAYEAPFAAGLWLRVKAATEVYATSLALQRRALCEENETPQAERAQMLQCLLHGREGLRSIVGAWSQGAPESLRNAPEMLAKLQSLPACNLLESTWHALDARVIELRAEATAGQYSLVEERAHSLVAALDDGSYSQLATRMELAKSLRHRSQIAQAIAEWEGITVASEAIGADDLRADAWIQLASTQGDEEGDVKAAAKSVQRATAILGRLGASPQLHRPLQLAKARLALREKRAEDAIGSLEFALVGELPRFEEAQIRQLLARGYLISGNPAQASSELVKAKGLVEAAAGPEHTAMIPVLNSMMEAYAYLGQLDTALSVGEEARRLTAASLGETSKRMISILNNLSNLQMMAGDAEASIALSRKVLAISEAKRGKGHPDLAIERMNLASALLAIEEVEEAEELYLAARTSLIDALGAAHPQVSFAEYGLGEVAAKRGDLRLAIAHLGRAVELRSGKDGDPFLLAAARFAKAQLLAEDGQRDAARRSVRTALSELPAAQNDRQATLVDELTAWLASH